MIVIPISDTIREISFNDAEKIYRKLSAIQIRRVVEQCSNEQKNALAKLPIQMARLKTQLDVLKLYQDKMGIEMNFLIPHGDIQTISGIIKECGWDL